MIRAGLLTLATLALPSAAVAHCGTSNNSFTITCEKGVQVYRHQAPSARPQRHIAPQNAQNIEQRRLEIEEERLAMERQAQADQAEIRRQELRAQRYRQRVLAQQQINRVRGYGPTIDYGFGLGGYRFAQPVRVRSAH